ncbi:hypothetical protein ACDL92_11890 [Ihubacter sp. mB4P-1]|uniref:hypothetical protein n=1 Tax=Ihubacter sp. mB4P-1 TaxID=3242370 RepID=UPI00216FFAEC|nr:hypothetical protein [Emergencia sp.]
MTKQEAIDILGDMKTEGLMIGDQCVDVSPEEETAINLAIIALQEPEQAYGEWLEMSDLIYKYTCSICMHLVVTRYNYCPHCGAKMEE